MILPEKHICSMHYSSLIVREYACVAFIVSVTISKAIVIRSFIFCFHCAGHVICLPFCLMRCNLREREVREKAHVTSLALGYQFADASRRVIACTTLKLARRSRSASR